MKRAIFATLLFLLAAFIAGCSSGHAKKDTQRQAPEVLLAQDCGMDKLQCCKTDPACLYSQQCCTDPNNPTRNYCSDKCTVGSKDEFCDIGNKCGDGLVCKNAICKECGKENTACCGDDKCDNGLVCNAGQCVRCGIEGNICCAGGKCLNENNTGKDRTACMEGKCTQCGALGAPCPGDIKCVPGYLYNNGTCYECGEANEPCCQENSGKPYDCNPKKYLKCFQGFCLE